MATLSLSRFLIRGKRSADPFETYPDLRIARDSVREYVAACRAARLRALRSARRSDVALRRFAAGASALALGLFAIPVTPAQAEDFNAMALRSCTTIASQACLLKPETRICSPEGRRCWYIGIDNFVAVKRFMGRRVLVMTEAGPAVAPANMLVVTPGE